MQASHADSPLIAGLPTYAPRVAEHIPQSNAGINLPNTNNATNSLGKPPIKVHNLSADRYGYSENSIFYMVLNSITTDLGFIGNKKNQKCNLKPGHSSTEITQITFT
jgi:hypothetical protein